jgi:AcrR family transcriptional regulator
VARKSEDPNPSPAPVGERILATATDLFYREGVRGVGIQRVIDEADIAKASLYAHYPSKDDLVAACISRRGAVVREAVERRLAASDLDARGQLLALFDFQVESVEGPDFRGCPFLNASSEIADPTHPVKAVIAAQRAWLHDLIARLVKDAGLIPAPHVAGTLIVLFDGGSSSSLIDGTSAAARHARWAAEQLLDAHRPARRRARTRARRRVG